MKKLMLMAVMLLGITAQAQLEAARTAVSGLGANWTHRYQVNTGMYNHHPVTGNMQSLEYEFLSLITTPLCVPSGSETIFTAQNPTDRKLRIYNNSATPVEYEAVGDFETANTGHGFWFETSLGHSFSGPRDSEGNIRTALDCAMVTNTAVNERADGSYTFTTFRNGFGHNPVRMYATNNLTGERIGIRLGTSGSYSSEVFRDGRTGGNAATMYNHVSVDKSSVNGVGDSFSLHAVALDAQGEPNGDVMGRLADRSNAQGTRVLLVQNDMMRVAVVKGTTATPNVSLTRIWSNTSRTTIGDTTRANFGAGGPPHTFHIIEQWDEGRGGIYEVRYNTVADYTGMRLGVNVNGTGAVGSVIVGDYLNGIEADIVYQTGLTAAGNGITGYTAKLTLPIGWTADGFNSFFFQAAYSNNGSHDQQRIGNFTQSMENGRVVLTRFQTLIHSASRAGANQEYHLWYNRGGRQYDIRFDVKVRGTRTTNTGVHAGRFGISGRIFRAQPEDPNFSYRGTSTLGSDATLNIIRPNQ